MGYFGTELNQLSQRTGNPTRLQEEETLPNNEIPRGNAPARVCAMGIIGITHSTRARTVTLVTMPNAFKDPRFGGK
jgi:hypothetical protein